MDIFGLAVLQLEREGKLNSKNEDILLLDRAITIRTYLLRREGNRKRSNKRWKKFVKDTKVRI